MELNKFKFNIVTKKDKKYIYDIIRKKYILLTEEEKVRQITINYLISELEIPISHISSEKGFLIDTGLNTLTGGRIKRIEEYIKDENPDVLLLQEIKTQDENFPYEEFKKNGYDVMKKEFDSWCDNSKSIFAKIDDNNLANKFKSLKN